MNLEEGIISSLLDCESISQAFELGLREEFFESPTNKAVVSFILKYWFDSNRTVAATADVLEFQFPGVKIVKVEEALEWLIDSIKKRFKDLAIAEALEEIASKVADDHGAEALQLMASSAWEIARNTTDRRSIADVSENGDVRFARYIDRATNPGITKGAPIGMAEVDVHTSGIHQGELAVMVGYPGTGKTWMLVNAAVRALQAGYVPYIASLELSRRDIEDRVDCVMSGVPYTSLLQGSLVSEDVDRLKDAQDRLKALGSLYVDHPPFSERTVRSLVNKAREAGSNYLLIDQLSFVQPRKYYQSTADRITEVVNELKVDISERKETELAVLMAAQFNRESTKQGKERGGLQHIGLSTSIEGVVDQAYGLTQSKEHRVNNAMVMDLLKFRRGPISSWLLNWQLVGGTRLSVEQEIDFE